MHFFLNLQGKRFRSANRCLPQRTLRHCGGPRGPWSSRAAHRKRTRRSTGRSASVLCTSWHSSPTRNRSWSCGCRRMGSCRRRRTPWTATCNRCRCKWQLGAFSLSQPSPRHCSAQWLSDSPPGQFGVFQVANLNGKDNTFTLKDVLYKEIQKDWPGYTEGDQQLLKRILFR